jgi:hypothetical protein
LIPGAGGSTTIGTGVGLGVGAAGRGVGVADALASGVPELAGVLVGAGVGDAPLGGMLGLATGPGGGTCDEAATASTNDEMRTTTRNGAMTRRTRTPYG